MDDEGVEVFLADGENFQARYLVDATGFRSVLADKLALRDQVPRAATCSRTIFSHVEGLRPFDELLERMRNQAFRGAGTMARFTTSLMVDGSGLSRSTTTDSQTIALQAWA